MSLVCSRCQERSAAGKHRWCRECQAAARRQRLLQRALAAPTASANAPNCPRCAALAVEIHDRDATIARLQRELEVARRRDAGGPSFAGGRSKPSFRPAPSTTRTPGDLIVCGGPGRCNLVAHAVHGHPGYAQARGVSG